MKNLIDILPENLKEGITPAEERLLEAVPKGNLADFSSTNEEDNKFENADKWGNDRIIRSEIFYWLCTNPDAIQNIHTKGIQLWGAKITGFVDFECVSIPHTLVMINCFFEEKFSFREAKTINLSTSYLKSFTADRADIEGTLVLNDVTAKGEVRLLGANINGNLDCTGASFENAEGDSFSGDGLTTKGSVSFIDVKAKREVRFLGANINGNLDCTGASFENADGNSFSGDGLIAKGDVFFSNVKAKGKVRFLGANINGNLICTGASFENAEGDSFSGDGLITKNSVFFRDVKAKGEIRLISANINGNLDCTGASFENRFSAERAKIGDGFFLDKIERIDGGYNLAYMNVGQLVDDENSWPNQDNLILTGFEYKGFAGGNTPTEADKRIKWIRLQDKKYFSTQPYEQLAKVYRQIGHESDAREVLIAKQEDLRKYGKLSRKAKLWNWFLGETIGHGYKPIKSLVIIFLLIIFGASMFFLADYCGVMQPSKERMYMSKEFIEKRSIPPEYPKFYFPTYSMDVFVPFLDLHQEDYWLPDSSKEYGFGFRIYFWIHILLGWVFSTLAAASLTGLIRKE